MNLTKQQLAVAGVIGSIVLIMVLIATGVIPGLKRRPNDAAVTGTMNVWVVGDPVEAYQGPLSAYASLRPKVTVNIRSFEGIPEYEAAVIDALAAGAGPDVFMIRNSSLPKYLNKVVAAPATISPAAVKGLFPGVVLQDFATGGALYGLPLSIDTLVLILNRDLLNQAGIVYVPATWESFKEAVPKLSKIDSTRRIVRAGAAIGTAVNIDVAPDLLSLLMIQTGTEMVNDQFTAATFASKNGEEAMAFYTQFSNPRTDVFTWSNALPSAIESFSRQTVAMVFGYAASIDLIRKRSPFVTLEVAPAPQPEEAVIKVAYPRYWGYVVSRQSRSQDLAWEFISILTTDPSGARAYLDATQRPPALLSLINEHISDERFGVFARQALIARSWPQADPDATATIFSRAIDSVANGEESVTEALKSAQSQVTQLMSRRLP